MENATILISLKKVADSKILQAMNTCREQSSSLVIEQARTTDQVQHHSIDVHGDSEQPAELLYPTDDGELFSGFKVPFDNFDIYQSVRDMTEDHQNKDIHWVNHNFVFNRLSGNHLPDVKPISSIKDLDNARLLPSMSEHSCQRLDSTKHWFRES